MNILFITAPQPPSPFHRIRALNLIKCLSRAHTIFLVAITNARHYNAAALQRYCREVNVIYRPQWRSLLACLAALPMPVPLEVAYCRDQRINRVVQDLLQRLPIDLVYIKRLRSAQYVPANARVPCVLDTTDAMSWYYTQAASHAPWFQKPLFFEEAVKYRWYERTMLRRFRHWVVCSPLDADYLRRLAPPATRLLVIPNGVDTEEFHPASTPSEPHRLLFSGLMDKFVNTQAAEWLVTKILPLIANQIPDVQLFIVGPHPTTKVRRLAGPRVAVMGEVADLREQIAAARVIVCPMKTGVGTRNKILQAWAMGRPVVTTAKGLEGLEAEPEQHALVADDAESFARQTVRLLSDAELRQRLSANGLRLIHARYSLDAMGRTLTAALEGVRQDLAGLETKAYTDQVL